MSWLPVGVVPIVVSVVGTSSTRIKKTCFKSRVTHRGAWI